MHNQLSKREREVVALIGAGKSSKETADALGIAWKTVTCHVARIHHKLRTHKAAELARYAMDTGLIEVPQLAAIRAAAEPVREWMGSVDALCMTPAAREHIEALLKAIETPAAKAAHA